MTWHTLPHSLPHLPTNQIIACMAGDKPISILLLNGKLFAFAANCPHAGAPLCEGYVDAKGSIVCPLHFYKFDPKTGRSAGEDGYKLSTYPTQINEDGSIMVYV